MIVLTMNSNTIFLSGCRGKNLKENVGQGLLSLVTLRRAITKSQWLALISNDGRMGNLWESDGKVF